MLTKKQLIILDVFRKNFPRKLMFNEIKNQAKIRSNSFLQRTLSNCMHEEIIEAEYAGKTLLYNLKINNITLAYFQLINPGLYNLPEKALYHIQQEISELTSAFTLVIFGSYAKAKQAKDSDLDIAVISEDKTIIPEVKAKIESIKLEELIKIDCEVFTVSDFKEMLESKKENVGKEIARNNLVFYNPSLFYKTIEKWNP